MIDQWYYLSNINPEPWQASQGSVGRGGGKMFVRFHKPEQLRSYQETVKSEFIEQNPHAVYHDGDIMLMFFFWRQLTSYVLHEETAKRRSHQADATNLQKALEDALQGTLYQNDRNIKSIQSEIVEQSNDTEPGILIGIGAYEPTRLASVLADLLQQPTLPQVISHESSTIESITDLF